QNTGRYPDQDDQRYPQQDDRRYGQQGGRQSRIETPSSRLRTYNGNFFRIAVPDNWRQLPSGDIVTFAPEGAYGNNQGQFVYTHGVQVGSIPAAGRSSLRA